MKKIIVSRDILEIYDKYDGDFGLLDERWASEENRQKVTWQQTLLLSEYVEKLSLTKVDTFSAQMKDSFLVRIAELEEVIDCEVIEIIRKRVLGY